MEVWRGNTWKEMNYFSCKKGCTRGGHYHKKTKELFFIIQGLCEVRIINIKTNKKVKFMAKEKDIFIVEPFEAHYIKAARDSKIVTNLDKPHNAEKPDKYEYKE